MVTASKLRCSRTDAIAGGGSEDQTRGLDGGACLGWRVIRRLNGNVSPHIELGLALGSDGTAAAQKTWSGGRRGGEL